MIQTAATWLYLVNVVLLILHEIDGAYWKEWNLIIGDGRIEEKKGLSLYLFAHIPIFILLLYGLLRIGDLFGLTISVILGLFLLVHFLLHLGMKKKREEFNAVSFTIIAAMAVVSLIQLPISLYCIFR